MITQEMATIRALWLTFLDVTASVAAVVCWFYGYWGLGCFLWLLSEIWNMNRIQYLLFASKGQVALWDGSWPWCEACKSYHHPKNPTCKA